MSWFALCIGNSRLHWAEFESDRLIRSWNEPHTYHPKPCNEELWIASVVPAQTKLWRSNAQTRVITLAQIPLQQLYPTFGIDRALALYGAIDRFQSDVLVIDCGTAMTFTGATADGTLIGGAIAPGLRSQFQTLNDRTAALPLVTLDDAPLNRWAKTTPEAIASGIIYGAIASVQDFVMSWRSQFPKSAIVMTGGDAEFLHARLTRELRAIVSVDLNLAFHGIAAVRAKT